MFKIMYTKLLLVSLITATKAFVQDPGDLRYPKCCGEEEIFVNKSELKCGPDEKKIAFLVVNHQKNAYKNCSESLYCLERFQDEVVEVHCLTKELKKRVLEPSLHKCCPPGFSYELEEHKCVKERIDSTVLLKLGNGTHLVHVGLHKCKGTVKDYRFSNVTEVQVMGDKSLRFDKGRHPFDNYCLDKVAGRDKYVARICHEGFDLCRSGSDRSKVRCIRKCCPDGQMYKGRNVCSPTYSHGLMLNHSKIVQSDEDEFAIIHGLTCKKNLDANYSFILDEHGIFHFEQGDTNQSFYPEEEKYCLEMVDVGKYYGYKFFICGSQTKDLKFLISKICLIISCVFLGACVLGYLFLQETKNLFGKTLLCYCCSLLATYVLLVTVQFNPKLNGVHCHAVGFMILFTFLATFTWLNIMCFDMWWTFGLWGWSFPVIWTVLTLIFFLTDILPDSISPQIGVSRCLLQNLNYGYYVFYVLPIAVIASINCILFLKTTYYCIKVKSEIIKRKDTDGRNKSFLADRERLSLLGKLFIVMGVSYIFEVVSSAIRFDSKPLRVVEIIFDSFNNLQGVFIFCIFIVKRKMIEAFKKKTGLEVARNSSQMTASSTLLSRISQNDRKISTNSMTVN